MYKSTQFARKTIPSTYKLSTSAIRPFQRLSFSTTANSNQKLDLKEIWGLSKMAVPNKEIPKHEMAYFKALATSKREFGDFRRVLFTGLYSQLVVMEVPVGGEIRDEVSSLFLSESLALGRGLLCYSTRSSLDRCHFNPGDFPSRVWRRSY